MIKAMDRLSTGDRIVEDAITPLHRPSWLIPQNVIVQLCVVKVCSP